MRWQRMQWPVNSKELSKESSAALWIKVYFSVRPVAMTTENEQKKSGLLDNSWSQVSSM